MANVHGRSIASKGKYLQKQMFYSNKQRKVAVDSPVMMNQISSQFHRICGDITVVTLVERVQIDRPCRPGSQETTMLPETNQKTTKSVKHDGISSRPPRMAIFRSWSVHCRKAPRSTAVTNMGIRSSTWRRFRATKGWWKC